VNPVAIRNPKKRSNGLRLRFGGIDGCTFSECVDMGNSVRLLWGYTLFSYHMAPKRVTHRRLKLFVHAYRTDGAEWQCQAVVCAFERLGTTWAC
jgi:hypothetical protein